MMSAYDLSRIATTCARLCFCTAAADSYENDDCAGDRSSTTTTSTTDVILTQPTTTTDVIPTKINDDDDIRLRQHQRPVRLSDLRVSDLYSATTRKTVDELIDSQPRDASTVTALARTLFSVWMLDSPSSTTTVKFYAALDRLVDEVRPTSSDILRASRLFDDNVINASSSTSVNDWITTNFDAYEPELEFFAYLIYDRYANRLRFETNDGDDVSVAALHRFVSNIAQRGASGIDAL